MLCTTGGAESAYKTISSIANVSNPPGASLVIVKEVTAFQLRDTADPDKPTADITAELLPPVGVNVQLLPPAPSPSKEKTDLILTAEEKDIVINVELSAVSGAITLPEDPAYPEPLIKFASEEDVENVAVIPPTVCDTVTPWSVAVSQSNV